MQEAQAGPPLDRLAGGRPAFRPNQGLTVARTRADRRLADKVLGLLPLGVAVIDAELRLLFWNEQAALLFGVPPLMAAAMPPLGEILAGVAQLTARQRDGIITFAAARIAAGDRAEPESCLRISLRRDHRLVIQLHPIGSGRWMLVIDDGRLAVTAGPNGAADGGVAWLDPLTGLHNRRHFNQVLRDLAEADCPGTEHPIGLPVGNPPIGHLIGHTVLTIDLDRFKAINDTLGHAIGDALLCLVAKRLRQETRADDLLARLGGDEFVILIASGERAEPLAARMVDVLSRPFLVEGHVANIGASIGIAGFVAGEASADDLMRYAELALYDAKSAGGGTWRLFDPAMAAQAQARRELETALRKALTMNELSVVYQPQLNVRTQRLTGFEALLRWSHPTLGQVSPSTFIPVAEEIGCIVALGEWVLKTACQEATRWPAAISVAVNVSPRQLGDSERLAAAVHSALQSSGLPPQRLELEITEGAMLSPDPHVLETLHRLRASGIRIAMDDFGTGYSSLSQLRSFPFDKIKIDRSFVAELGFDGEAAAMIQAIATLAAGLGMTTIAEGVETEDQAALVGAHGCTDIQGYLLSRPIAALGIDEFITRYAGTSPEREHEHDE
ncbi:putative bifunctional diguanylate cyclase/phosphodiesterase [Rhodopila sp.]|uniref:putative bifunctional diguanylate cyclase/phosphodiesterase n=1 Tax=Rhodopila sp. TaxID=2480087 RepID=UPI003D1395AB